MDFEWSTGEVFPNMWGVPVGGVPVVPGRAAILIFLSVMIVSPFSSPTSTGSFVAAVSSSYLYLGKYKGSNLQDLKMSAPIPPKTIQLSYNSLGLSVRSLDTRSAISSHLWCMLWRYCLKVNEEQPLGLLRAKLDSAPLGMLKRVQPSNNQYRMFFIQTSTLPPSIHHKLTEHGRYYI